LKKLVKQGLGLTVKISMAPYLHKFKNKFQFEEESIGIVFFIGLSIPLLFKIAQNFPL